MAFDLNKGDLSEINEDIEQLLNDNGRLYYYEYSGNIQSFTEDVKIMQLEQRVSSKSSIFDNSLVLWLNIFQLILFLVVICGLIYLYFDERKIKRT